MIEKNVRHEDCSRKKNASIQLERKAFFRNARERYLFFWKQLKVPVIDRTNE